MSDSIVVLADSVSGNDKQIVVTPKPSLIASAHISRFCETRPFGNDHPCILRVACADVAAQVTASYALRMQWDSFTTTFNFHTVLDMTLQIVPTIDAFRLRTSSAERQSMTA